MFRKKEIMILLLVGLLSACTHADVAAQEFTITSPVMVDGGTLPADLKCTRDDGDGKSPPIAWTNAPTGTNSFAIVMHHYPRDRVPGVDKPSHYWLVWNVPADTTAVPRGNPASLGHEGGDKDKRYVGYTPPCSPGDVKHEYTITVYALDSDSIALGNDDDIDVDWEALTGAIEGKVLASSSLTFVN